MLSRQLAIQVCRVAPVARLGCRVMCLCSCSLPALGVLTAAALLPGNVAALHGDACSRTAMLQGITGPDKVHWCTESVSPLLLL